MPLEEQRVYVGMRVNKNIYNNQGTLIVPIMRVLTDKEIELLIRQGVTLSEQDVEPAPLVHLIESTIREVRELFAFANRADRIPYEDIQDKIIPIILFMSNHPNLNQILFYLEVHDEYVYRHSIAVALLSKLIGKARGFNDEQALELMTAGFLHDIGKSRIPGAILNKPGRLTEEEFAIVKEHTLHGFEILKNSTGLPERHAYVALQHHEREDGSGYPFGLKADQIDPYSKIVAVADVFHAMVSKRVYKDPLPLYRVLMELSDNVYGTLEPASTLSFLKRIMDMLIGNAVELSDGREGKIVMVSAQDPVRPIVEVAGEYIDLSKRQDLNLDKIVF
ncbi:HD-GYP domain-containing protein [Cohnella herbarum]|uniref:HD-GYP domain-containing protein n=1 Tax=Cohnella herbarum TaxID=2728023 RepID=A0A7Z2VLY5_9BACL|nr:HD-GYP domain-containing protein [Cohnella herbarum]QJD85487.1 HD-GYP domain-containing protein [Cohnella herbarum]